MSVNHEVRRALVAVAATRDRHFPKALKQTRHLATCSRGDWQGNRERWTNADGERWGAPCTPNCVADHAAFDAVDALLAENALPEPVQLEMRAS